MQIVTGFSDIPLGEIDRLFSDGCKVGRLAFQRALGFIERSTEDCDSLLIGGGIGIGQIAIDIFEHLHPRHCTCHRSVLA